MISDSQKPFSMVWLRGVGFTAAIVMFLVAVGGGIVHSLVETGSLPSVRFGYDQEHDDLVENRADRARIVDLRTAASIDIDNPHALMRLLNVSREMHDDPGRVLALRGLLHHQPDSAVLHSQLAGALLDTRDPKEAVVHSSIAVRLQPDEARNYLIHGAVLLALGQKRAAAEAYRTCLRLNPELEAAQLALQYMLEGY